MGDLVKQTPYSEVTATLELFDSLGVTRAHLTRLRSDREAAERVVRLILGIGVQSVAKFDPGVLDTVRGLGGQFAGARMTTVLGGETLESQRKGKVIRFYTDWHFRELGKNEELFLVAPSIGSEVIYLPVVVEGSLRCTFDKVKVEARDSVQDSLERLPKMEGLRWIVGNPPTVTRVLANHLKETGEYLLPNVYTWTTGNYKSPEYGLLRLVVGYFSASGVVVSSCRPVDGHGDLGFFVLGVPA